MTVHTTYFAALQHDLDVLDGGPSEDVLVASILAEPRAIDHDDVDRNINALAPPKRLRERYDAVREAGADDPHVDDPVALAWRTVNYEDNYREYLDGGQLQPILSRLRERERDDGAVWLVCYEKDPAYCARRVLADVLTRARAEDPVHHPAPSSSSSPEDRLPDAQLHEYATPDGGPA